MARLGYDAKYENSWSLIVGINAYEHAPPLGYACNDAQAFAGQLIERFKFPKENVSLLLDKDATLRNIQAAMHALSRKAGENDRVIVFYAGHGCTQAARRREAGFLVPVEGRADDTSTLLPWDDLVSTSYMIPAKHLLFIMDACYGGLIGMRALAPGAMRFARDMLTRYSRQFLTAGKADEPVADCGGPRKHHSVFTGHLLDALEGGLGAPDGLISAGALMNYVYDKVSKDPQSRQAPHYGFLDGDGDLFFTIPDVATSPSQPKDTGDVLIEVPADLTAPEEILVAPPLVDQVKEYLSDRKHRIQLNDLVMRELRAAQQRLGDEQFSVQGSNITKEQLAERLLKYETAINDLLRVSVLLGRWADDDHQPAVRQIVTTITGQELAGGLTLWLALRSFPMLLIMYAGGIAAMEGDNYVSLRTLLSTPVQINRHSPAKPAVEHTSEAMQNAARAEAFKSLPGYEDRYTPMSDYLFKRLQPIVEDQLFLGARYEALFDRFEMLYALSYVDASGGSWGHAGRFGWKYRGRMNGSDPFTALLEEAKQEGDNWSPLRAGMFRGSRDRFSDAAQRFKTELLDKLSWH